MHDITDDVKWKILELVQRKITELGLTVDEEQHSSIVQQLYKMYREYGFVRDFTIRKEYIASSPLSAKIVGGNVS